MVPLVSIIVPVYNVSQYLRQCLDSIINQTLQDIEIIIVNDCSPDPLDDEICREYAAKDSRIVYISHEKNLGLGGARNTGIKVAKAKYIGGVDSDDWIEHNMFELLYANAQQTEADIIICGYAAMIEGSRHDTVFDELVTEVGLKQMFTIVNYAFWNKLWKKSLFIDNNIFFPENLYFEDVPTTPVLLLYTKNISIISDVLYFYRRHRDSITYNITYKMLDDSVEMGILLKDVLHTHGYFEKVKKDYYIAFMKHLHYIFQHIHMNATSKTEYELTVYLMHRLFQLDDIEDFLYYNDITIESIRVFWGVENIHRYNDEEYKILYSRIKNDRWYIFGQSLRRDKIKILIKMVIKKLIGKE